MKKSIWIFLLAVLVPGIVLGWLALRSAGEQQIIFERRTAELYQKETEDLAAEIRQAIESERRAFGDVVHRLLANGDAKALARDFTNTLTDAWQRKAVGFVLGEDGRMLSPSSTLAASNLECRTFLWDNGSFLGGLKPALVYPVQLDGNKAAGLSQSRGRPLTWSEPKPALTMEQGAEPLVPAQKPGQQPVQQVQQAFQSPEPRLFVKTPIPERPQNAGPAPKESSDLKLMADVPLSKANVPSQDELRELAGVTKQEWAKDPAEAKTRNAVKLQVPAAADPKQMAPATDPVAATGLLRDQPMPEERKDAVKFAEKMPRPAPGAPTAAAPPPEPATAAPALRAAVPAPPAPGEAPTPAGQKADDHVVVAGLGAQAGTRGQALDRAMAIRPDGTVRRATDDDTRQKKVAEDLASGAAGFSSKDFAESATNLQFGHAPALQKQKTGKEAATDWQTEAFQLGTTGATQSQVELQGTQNMDAVQAAPDSNFSYHPAQNPLNRLVEPQQSIRAPTANWSAVIPATADFRALTAGSEEGMLSRFVQDKLDLIFWIRPPEAPELVFGCLIEAAHLSELWTTIFHGRNEESNDTDRPAYVLALLDDKAQPIASFPRLERARDWKRPFVASEIGEALPHWEAALYLATPTAIADTARGLRRTLSFTIVAAVALIAIGGWLVAADVRRQLALAQQKTDFVSNVSHELKTPLTSIRMFAELMHDRPPPAEKQGQYLRIITVEAERLTRLINNVLDFAKLERRQKRFDKKPLDLQEVVGRVWEGQEMHLQDAGFATRWEAAPGPYPVTGDEDALAQILVNLLSNAEKYSQETKDIELVTWLEDGWVNVSVLDRGMGVPDGEERKIFEAFYRAHDSLSSGIQGSGLGLTLAHRLAREHGGEVLFERRQGGGCRFTLRLPLAADSKNAEPGGAAADR